MVMIVTASPVTVPLIEANGPDEVEAEPDSEPDPDCVIIHVCGAAASPADPQQLHVPEMFTPGGGAASAATPNPPGYSKCYHDQDANPKCERRPNVPAPA